MEIMANPAAGAVIPRADGLRKIRFARRGAGKSGGVRVCYANIGGHGIVLLACVYAKGRQADLTAAQIDRLVDILAAIIGELEGR